MIRRFFIFLLAMACPVLAMAISAPSNLRWDYDEHTFYWTLDPDAPYCTYTFDGVTRGFICYQCDHYEVDTLLLSPGVHTFCIYACDAQLNCSEWECMEIFIHEVSDSELPKPPVPPLNLQAWQSGPNEITLTWLPGDDNARFCVFLDSRAINYSVTANSFVIRGVEGGWHTVGVCSMADDGYVSDMVAATVYCQSASTYTVSLAQAHWSFENDPDYLRFSVELTNTPLADYAYSGTSALLLESPAGQLAYVALPMISDVPDYDSLQLSFVARGGYWSTGAEIWAKSSNDHHLVVGAMKELPYTGFQLDSVQVLLDTVLPYATPFTMDDPMADTASFWRTFTISLDSATLPYLVFCGTSHQPNYLILDDIRITRLLPSDPSDPLEPSDPDVDSSIDYVPASAPHKVLRDGSVFIIRDGVEYTILGTALRH